MNTQTNITPSKETYQPETHYLTVANDPYYIGLLQFRSILKQSIVHFFTGGGYTDVDLFMFTNSVSSPMGPGSDSEAISIPFGNHHTYLVDSSQFGFEPLLLQSNTDKLFCYLPSMRGENPDKRHLNQFYHAEAEIKGNLNDIMTVVEQMIFSINKDLLDNNQTLISELSKDSSATINILQEISMITELPRITFDEAIVILEKTGEVGLYNHTDHGSDITSIGELRLAEELGYKTPFWITHYHRDRVPFYQKPDTNNTDTTLNADLIFPNLTEMSFGGEIIGSGQRQDTISEMYQSLERQGLSSDPYGWYIDIRNHPNHTTTSGFGMGIERYIAWLLCLSDIKFAAIYPCLKNVRSNP